MGAVADAYVHAGHRTRADVAVVREVEGDHVSHAAALGVAEDDSGEAAVIGDIVLDEVEAAVFIEVDALVIGAAADAIMREAMPDFTADKADEQHLAAPALGNLHVLDPATPALLKRDTDA